MTYVTRKYSEETRLEALARYATGDSASKISSDMGVNLNTIYYWLKRAKSEMYPRGPRPQPVTNRKKQQVLVLRKSGHTVKEICEKTGLSVWKVRQITKNIPAGGGV